MSPFRIFPVHSVVKGIDRQIPVDAGALVIIDLLYDVYSSSPKQGDGRPEWGDRAVWEELHRKDPFPFWLD